jgi:cytochrome c oxidase subunit 4
MTDHKKHASPSPGLLIGVYIALMVLLALTVIAAAFPIPSLSLLIALAIAGAKAALVILFFMHVRYSAPVTRVFVAAGFVWLSILFTLTLLECMTR